MMVYQCSHKFNLKLFFSLFFIIFGSSFCFYQSRTQEMPPYFHGIRLLFFLIGIIGLLFFVNKKPLLLFSVIKKKYCILWALFSITCIIGGIEKGEFSSILDGGWYLFVILPVFFILPNKVNDLSYHICLSGILALCCHLVPSIIINPPILGIFYKGYFGNPNQMALLCTCLFILILFLFVSRINNGCDSLNMVVFSFFLCFIFAIILLTASRTALLISVVNLFLSLPLVLKKRRITRILIHVLPIVMLLATFGLFYGNFYNSILESVEKKIELRGKQDSIFAGRENNWTSILSERKVFGFKKEFIEKQYEIGAHNTFLGILQEYGIICFCFFLMLYIFLLKKIIKILFTTTQLFKYNHLPIMVIISFGMYGFTESFIFTIGNPLVILYLFSIGVIQKKTLVGGKNESCSYKVGI